MTKCFCDRCGKEINKNEKSVFITHNEYSKLSFLGMDLAKRNWEGETLICDNCTDSFIHWFENVEEEK